MEARLSVDQKHILQFLLSQYEEIEQGESEHAKGFLPAWGVYWRVDHPSRSESASMSRSLRRLEDRGLVQRKNDWKDGSKRSNRVLLTPKGREVAKRLTS